MSAEILVYETAQAAAEACGARIFELAAIAKQQRGRALLAVSGGSTPRIMFEWMAKQAFDWSGIELFWVDERCVPPDDAQSNYRMTRESLLDYAALRSEQVHRVRGEAEPVAANERYIEEIRSVFGLKSGELPEFDVVQRGMGPDAHTASLFPEEPLIRNQTQIAAAVWVEKMKQHRVTLLPGTLEKARASLCLATGTEKQRALRMVLTGAEDIMQYPAQLARERSIWFVDRAAKPD